METLPDPSVLSTYERRQLVAQQLSDQQRVTVSALSKMFGVSEVTIRKDLAWLEERKLLVRTHGGATLAKTTLPEQAFDVREREQHDEKLSIGALAAQLVQNGDCISLDASTTALAMTQYLRDKREVTVVTNGLRSGMALAPAPGIAVLMPGGMLRHESVSLVGTWGKSVLEQINIKTAFVSARGITVNEGLTDVDSEEVAFKRSIVESAKEVILLVDHSKWGKVALATFCPLNRVKLIITDAQAPLDLIEEVRKAGVEVRIAGE